MTGKSDFANAVKVVIVNSTPEVILAVQKLTLFIDAGISTTADQAREHLKRTLMAARLPVTYTLKSSWFIEGDTLNVLTREGVKQSKFLAMIGNDYYTILLSKSKGEIVATMVSVRLGVDLIDSNTISKQQQLALHTFKVNAWQPITIQALKRYGFDPLMPDDLGKDNDDWNNFNVINDELFFGKESVGYCVEHHRNDKRVIVLLSTPVQGKHWCLIGLDGEAKDKVTPKAA